jgi:tRNA(Ile)-lysidine synthase
MGLEEAARICRYRFLMSVAQKASCPSNRDAHHMDDQVETILMHFLRGSGINGLRGMRSVELLRQFSEKVPVWRPLLETGKEEILDYCMQNQIEPIEDESNQDLRIYRNRLRQVLIPQIEDVQPSFRTILARNANVIELDRQVLEKMTEIAWQQSLVEEFEEKLCYFLASE